MAKKHVYTCPDVIYDRKIAQQRNRVALASNLIIIVALIGYGRYLERKANQPLPQNTRVI